MNAFAKVLEREYADDTKLGMPSKDATHRDRRLAAMSRMTGGRGFTTQPKEPRTNADGTTRGERKRKARATALALVSETRPYEYLHGAQRRRTDPDRYYGATMKVAA